MKKLLFLSCVFLSLKSEAQLNYLFSAFSKPYQSVSDGAIVPLQFPPYGNTIPEEYGTALLPIGFNFTYNERVYSSLTVNVNGFISLGYLDPEDPCLNYSFNSLAEGTCSTPAPNTPLGLNSTRPIIAPFWEDLGLHSTADIVYKTSGFAPNRIFTIEWKNAYRNIDNPNWPFPLNPGSRRELLSLQARLYEKDNAIEFHYQNQGDEPYPAEDPMHIFINLPPYGNYGANIGLSSSDCTRDMLSLQSGSDTTKLTSIFDPFIFNQPASNQVFRFEPAITRLPKISRNKLAYTDRTVTFNLDPGTTDPGYVFEYAINNSLFPPQSGTITNERNVRVGGLQPDTRYFVHARARYRGLYSQWTSDVFKTASPSLNVPYLENFENPPGYGMSGGFLPNNFRVQDIFDTLYYGIISEFSFDPTYSGPYVFYGFPFVDGNYSNNNSWSSCNNPIKNNWSYTPGIRLNKGQKYRLSFRYSGFPAYFDVPISPAHLEVRYGTGSGLGGMNTGLLFDKADIANYEDFADTSIVFTAPKTDVYYFGFHDFGPYDQNTGNYSYLSLDDISVTEFNNSTFSRELPITLNGTNTDLGNELSWNGGNSHHTFNLESSIDGVYFNAITHKAKDDGKRIIRRSRLLSSDETKEINRKNSTNQQGGYVMEISKDGNEFKRFSKDAIPVSKQSNNYVDNNTASSSETVYYRVCQKDEMGRKIYSNIVSLSNNSNSIKVYPNPSSGKFNLQLPDGNTYKVTVLNINGQSITTYYNVRQNLNFGEELPRGTYMIKLQSGNKITTHKIVKQ